MSPELEGLIHLSNAVGRDVAYVQGGGGNTSLKVSDEAMYIKASGRFLADIRDETGFVAVNWNMLRREVSSCETEADYSVLLKASTRDPASDARPSIETGFHALLGRCTLHTHSVWANLLTCSEEGPEQVRKLFPSAVWVPYATPGLALTKEIAARTKGATDVTLFLQNHGLVVSAADVDTAREEHERITRKIRTAYPTLPDYGEEEDETGTQEIEGLLFPDQAVYLRDPALAESRAGVETISAAAFLADRIPRAGLTLKYLDEAERSVLLGLDSEKYRQKLITQ